MFSFGRHAAPLPVWQVCGNAKTFWEHLAKEKTMLKSTSFAVFGLGDSHYWGEGTADSAK